MTGILQTDPFALSFGKAAQLLDPRPSVYYNDPLAWVHDFIQFKDGEGLTPYQEEILGMLPIKKKVSVRGPHGLGKTALMSLAIIWFCIEREGASDDWKVPTLASVWRQLEKFLWPEIHKWARRIDWDKLGRQPWRDGRDLLELNLKLRFGSAFALASDTPESLEGAHADHLMYVFDEAKAIPSTVFDAAEGAFSGAGGDTVSEALALVVSTPGEPTGRFADIQLRRPGTEDWWVRHVTKEEAIAAGRISEEWVEARKRQWGENSSIYQNRVEGQFAKQSETSIIPLQWVEDAVERWKSVMEAEVPLVPLSRLGCDIARSGEDKTVFAPRHGRVVAELKRYSLADTMTTSGRIKAHLEAAKHGIPVVDVIGIGAGVVDRLREQDVPTVAFNGSEKSDLTDVSGEVGFLNRRAAAWWTMRELLDPSNNMDICLPDDDMMIGDLVAPGYSYTSSGKIKVEGKDDVKKRIGRSPDSGDAVVLSFAPPEPAEDYEEMVEYYEPVEISPL